MGSEMIKTVIRDKDGNVINIGDWDCDWKQNEFGETVAMNPLPEGAYEDTAEIVVGWDGGLYEASDPRANQGI